MDIVVYTLVSAGIKFRFRYGKPAYTGPFRAMDIVYNDKCRYAIQEQEVPVWQTGMYRCISSNVYSI
jgi:hypothetical protein